MKRFYILRVRLIGVFAVLTGYLVDFVMQTFMCMYLLESTLSHLMPVSIENSLIRAQTVCLL